MALETGDKAPNFRLATDDGGNVSLAGFKGRPFVLYFYPKDDTSGCTKEAIAFSGALKKFEKLGVSAPPSAAARLPPPRDKLGEEW